MKTFIKNRLNKLLNEIAISGNDLNSGIGLILTNDYLILFDFLNKRILGVISLYELDSNLWSVGVVAAEKGYGPLMYQLGMTHVPTHNIIADRDSNTSESAINIYREMYKRGLAVKTLNSSDENYVKYNQKSEEENMLLNTIFHFEDKNTYNQLVNASQQMMGKLNDPDRFLEKINDNAFDYFSTKMDYAYA